MSLPWKCAMIVGASSGIGEALARQLTASGCKVAMIARRETELQRIAGEINCNGEKIAFTYAHDVTNYEEIPALFQTVARDLAGLDLVIYASGVMPAIAEGEYNFEKDRQMIEVNLLGAIAWLNLAAERFEKAKSGTIVGISSVAGERGRRGMPVYCASKAALTTYLESLRNRVARFGVSVVTVKPGPVATPMTEGLGKLPLLISADKAASDILSAAKRGASNAFVPGAWRYIFLIIRNLPSFVFKKLNF